MGYRLESKSSHHRLRNRIDAVDIVGGGAFGVTGQACTACSRAIIHEQVYNEFVDGIAAYAESIEVGPELTDPAMGPHVTADELASTLEYIFVGENEGATLETAVNAFRKRNTTVISTSRRCFRTWTPACASRRKRSSAGPLDDSGR